MTLNEEHPSNNFINRAMVAAQSRMGLLKKKNNGATDKKRLRQKDTVNHPTHETGHVERTGFKRLPKRI